LPEKGLKSDLWNAEAAPDAVEKKIEFRLHIPSQESFEENPNPEHCAVDKKGKVPGSQISVNWTAGKQDRVGGSTLLW